MKYRIPIFLIWLIIAYSGCAMQPEPAESNGDAVSLIAISDLSGSSTELPNAYGPINQKHKPMQTVTEIFRTVDSLRNAKRFTVAELQHIPRTNRYRALVLSQCSLKVLKVLVISGWVPVVITKSPVGPRHIRAIVGYDNIAEYILLADPINYATARIKYSDFSKQWDDPRMSCLVVLSGQGSIDKIRSKLNKYLGKDEIDRIIIKTARKQ